MWSIDQLVRIAADSLRGEDARLSEEQAVSGLDALDELGLHPLLCGGFSAAGFGVFPEQPYAGDVESRHGNNARERCDLVLTEEPGVDLLDPVEELKQLDRATGTLFEPVAAEVVPDGRVVAPDEAFWLEVKVVAQHTYVGGVPGPNAGYSSELVAGPAGDVEKLAREATIASAGVLLALFGESEQVVEHDLMVVAHRLLDRGLPVSAPALESFSIQERAGNAACGIAVYPVRL